MFDAYHCGREVTAMVVGCDLGDGVKSGQSWRFRDVLEVLMFHCEKAKYLSTGKGI